jgi:hypothetical protein
MKSITAKKPLEEIIASLGRARKVAIWGCGTCPAMMRTGGLDEVLELRSQLEGAGFQVTHHEVIPVACEPLPLEAHEEFVEGSKGAEAAVVLSCSLGVRQVCGYFDSLAIPGLNTIFTGREEEPGVFVEDCRQCGDCVLARTGGICPITRCAKSLFNGPCGGSVAGKCEVDPSISCGWQEIYDRMKELGRLGELEEIEPVRDWSVSWHGGPRRMMIPG